MTPLALNAIAQGLLGLLCLWTAWHLWFDDDEAPEGEFRETPYERRTRKEV